MNDADWNAWVNRHAALFAMTRDEDMAMFREWRREFVAMGFTAMELHSATDFISREAKGLTRWDHLEAIRDHIRDRRRRATPKPTADHDSRGTCSLCGDTGWAGGLPHLSQLTVEGWLPLVDGRPALTQAAVCTCIVGRWIYEAWEGQDLKYKEKYKRPMGLPEYTRLNSMWQAQVRELAERHAAKARSEGAARAADKSGDLVFRRALQRVVDNAQKQEGKR